MDKIRANIPRPSQYERPSAVPFISQEALEIAALPYENFIKPTFEGMKRIGGKLVDAAAGRDVQYTSDDLSAFADTMAWPGILAGPSGPGVAGVIRQPEAVAKHLRKLMKAERSKWGKPDPGDVFGEVLRQPLYRGQKTIPEPHIQEGKVFTTSSGEPVFNHGTETFAGMPTMQYAHTSVRNFGEAGYKNNAGEPARGVSMSTDPQIARGFSRRGDKISRVLPLYGGRPEDVILNAVNPEHQKVLKEAYADTVKTLFDMGRIAHPGDRPFTYRDLRGNIMPDEFNRINTEKLIEKGYKGVLHSPHRYNKERELQMFRGEDVMHIDEFPYNSPDVGRLWGSKPRDRVTDKVITDYIYKKKPEEFLAILSETDSIAPFIATQKSPPEEVMKKLVKLIPEKEYHALLEEGSRQYLEAAKTKKAMVGLHSKRQEDWDKKTAGDMLGYRQGALGVLYKDIDLDSLFPDSAKKYKPGYKPPEVPKPKWDNADDWDALTTGKPVGSDDAVESGPLTKSAAPAKKYASASEFEKATGTPLHELSFGEQVAAQESVHDVLANMFVYLSNMSPNVIDDAISGASIKKQHYIKKLQTLGPEALTKNKAFGPKTLKEMADYFDKYF